MAIQNITYNTKEALQDDETVPIENKVTANDMNEIKTVVNNNADELTSTRRKIHDDKEELLDYITDISLDVGRLKTGKVDKETGKGLSTNDYTNEEKAQLSTNTTNITTLTTESGHTIELSLNNTTFVLTANLKNKAGTIISSSNVDLPIESLVKDIQYDSTTKEIVFILQDGTTRRIPLSDLISGLQTEITEQNKLSSDLVDDTNKTHKFVTANEKLQITENKNEIEKLQTKVTNLEETVNSELEDGVAEGTEITVNDSANADGSLLPNGNTSQNQYEGRNQFNKSNIANIGSNLVTELETGEEINVGNSATGNAVFSVWAVLDLTNYVGKTIRAKTKFTASGNNKGRYYIGLGNSTGGNRTSKAESTVSDNEISFTVPELAENQNYLILALYSNFNGRAEAYDYIRYEDVIITIDNENLDYEKYVGGHASPSTEYPQTVHTLKGNNTIIISNSDNTKQQVKTLALPEGLEMCNITDYRDRFVKRGNNWVVPNKIQKIDSYNGETITTLYISTTGGLDTGATVYYVGDTDLAITDETLISELEELLKIRTYYGQTNVTVEAEDLAPMMTLNYKKSNRALRSEINSIKARLDLLEG